MIQFGPKLSNLIFHDLLSENFFEILWHDGAYICLWSNMDPIWPKITQLVLTALRIFRNILAQWSAIVRLQSIIQENSILWKVAIWAKFMQTYDLLSKDFLWNYVAWQDVKGEWTVGQLFQLIRFSWKDQLRPNLGQNYATLFDDLVFFEMF